MNKHTTEGSDTVTMKESTLIVLISTIIYALYVQFSPGLGNIWIRQDSQKKNRFSPYGLINMMRRPFHDIHFWKFPNLHMNWVFFSTSSIGIFALGKFLCNKK